MFSAEFLSSYCFFSGAVSVFRSTLQKEGGVTESKAAADAFKSATAGMSKQDRTTFIEYMRWLFGEPGRFEREKRERYFAESNADDEFAKSGGHLIDEGRIIAVADFIERTGITLETLARKVCERRIFKIPDWVDGILPCHFGSDVRARHNQGVQPNAY